MTSVSGRVSLEDRGEAGGGGGCHKSYHKRCHNITFLFDSTDLGVNASLGGMRCLVGLPGCFFSIKNNVKT